jgi:hypothetical protein
VGKDAYQAFFNQRAALSCYIASFQRNNRSNVDQGYCCSLGSFPAEYRFNVPTAGNSSHLSAYEAARIERSRVFATPRCDSPVRVGAAIPVAKIDNICCQALFCTIDGGLFL